MSILSDKEKLKNRPIGFMDSGVGGLSVLREAVRVLPAEDFIYFGDSANAPYGTKTVKEIRDLTFKAVENLMDYDIKALVVACNTATRRHGACGEACSRMQQRRPHHSYGHTHDPEAEKVQGAHQDL